MNARPWVNILGFEFAILALIALGIVGLIRGASGPDDDHAMAASPVVTVELSTVTPAIAADYQYAAERRIVTDHGARANSRQHTAATVHDQ